jgi:hypothetical protein
MGRLSAFPMMQKGTNDAKRCQRRKKEPTTQKGMFIMTVALKEHHQ